MTWTCARARTGFASGLGGVGVALVVGAAIALSAKTAPDRFVCVEARMCARGMKDGAE